MSIFNIEGPRGLMRRLRDVSLFASVFLAGSACAELNNDTSPTSLFKSRPDLHAPIIDFKILRPELVSPGYIFLAPYRNLDPGPYIYDNWGNLVWSGAGDSGPKTAHTPRVCQYKGEDHLCYYEGMQHQGFARGHGVIMNKHYQVVQTVEASGTAASSDMHEFKLTPYSNGTTALMTVYQPRQYDLSTNPRFNVHNGMGWIVEGVFQEIEIGSGRVVFEWRSLDHVDPGDSWTMPGTTDTSGSGLTEDTPWDYFHLNSVDKNADGDYLLSARHTSAIYKVSGQNGTILWQLGGNTPTIKQENFIFSYQHHARFVSENGTHTLFSFFDNASNAFNHTSDRSHGWIIAIDHATQRARKIREWGAPEPEGGMLSGSQGNMQILPNGNVHIGWGEHAAFSEHTARGKPVQYGNLATRPSNVMIYRSNKYNWIGEPLTKPALWSFAKSGKAKTSFFVSWNGATEVASWEFFAAKNSSGPFHRLNEGNSTVKKTGFETVYRHADFSAWSYANALDKNGKILASSVVARTFVPSEKLAPFCGDEGCQQALRVDGDARTPYEKAVKVPEKFLSTHRGFNTTSYYVQSYQDELLQQGEDGGSKGSSWWWSSSSSSSSSGNGKSGSSSYDNEADSPSSSSSSPSLAHAASALHRTATSSTGSSIFILFLGGTLGFLSSYFLSFLRRTGALSLRRRSSGTSSSSGGGRPALVRTRSRGGGSGHAARIAAWFDGLVAMGVRRSVSSSGRRTRAGGMMGKARYYRIGEKEGAGGEEEERFVLSGMEEDD